MRSSVERVNGIHYFSYYVHAKIFSMIIDEPNTSKQHKFNIITLKVIRYR